MAEIKLSISDSTVSDTYAGEKLKMGYHNPSQITRNIEVCSVDAVFPHTIFTLDDSSVRYRCDAPSNLALTTWGLNAPKNMFLPAVYVIIRFCWSQLCPGSTSTPTNEEVHRMVMLAADNMWDPEFE